MTSNGWLQICFFLLVILVITKPLGVFMAHVFSREKTFLDFGLRPLERLIYRLTGIREEHEMRWTEYGITMLLFSAVSMFAPSTARAAGRSSGSGTTASFGTPSPFRYIFPKLI